MLGTMNLHGIEQVSIKTEIVTSEGEKPLAITVYEFRDVNGEIFTVSIFTQVKHYDIQNH